MIAASGLHWTEKKALPIAQAGGAAAMVRGTMVMAGGTDWENGVKLWLREVQLYDTATDQWRMGPVLPRGLAYGPSTVSGEKLEIYGGTDGVTASRRIYVLNARMDAWTEAGLAPTGTVLGQAARVGRTVYLMGGCEDVADLTTCSDAVWMREDGKSWKKIGKLPAGPVANAATAVLDGKVYLFGGCSMAEGKLRNHAEGWVFDPAAGSWKALRNLPAANRGITAAEAAGKVFLFGGYTDEGFSADVLAYDAAADTYVPQAPMPLAVMGIRFFAHDGKLWGAGGEDRMRSRSARTLSAQLP